MKNYIILFALLAGLAGCSKQFNLENRLIGTWNLTEHVVDGVLQDSIKGVRLDFKGNGRGDCFNEAGYTYFTYWHFKDRDILKLQYASGWIEEYTVTDIKVIPSALSYSDPTAAPEQFMRLKSGNQEFKFVKEYEE